MKLSLIRSIAVVAMVAISFVVKASDLSTPSAEGAVVYIVSPKDGDTVEKDFTVVFGLKGMGVAPAGVEKEFTGHHHLLVNKEELPSAGLPLGSDVMHFGKGQTEASLSLEPGTHTLQLLLANHLHVPHTPLVMSEKITVTVSD